MYMSVLLPSILALFALYKNKLTLPAIVLAWIFGIIICYLGDIYAFIALATTFILTILSDKLRKNNNDEKRNIYQIICNVFIPSLCIILYYLFKDIKFYVMFYCTIGSSLADTLASSIGSLSKKIPLNPLTFKKMKKGESGAISVLGLIASALGGVTIGLIYYLKYSIIINYIIIIIMSFLGSYIDSLLGSCAQARYKCFKCNEIVEEKLHCGNITKRISGLSWINNNVVNFSNNLLIFFISFILL